MPDMSSIAKALFYNRPTSFTGLVRMLSHVLPTYYLVRFGENVESSCIIGEQGGVVQ